MRVMKALLITLLLLASCASAGAQTPKGDYPDFYIWFVPVCCTQAGLSIRPAGGIVLPSSSITCGLDSGTAPAGVLWWLTWGDPLALTKLCGYDMSALVQALPAGTWYVAFSMSLPPSKLSPTGYALTLDGRPYPRYANIPGTSAPFQLGASIRPPTSVRITQPSGPPPPLAPITLKASSLSITRGASVTLTLTTPTLDFHNVFINGVRPAIAQVGTTLVCTLVVTPSFTTTYQAEATTSGGIPYTMPSVTVTVLP